MFNLLVIPKVIVIIETLVQLTNGYDGQHPDVRDSPRQFQTKYGTLRGIIIPLQRESSASSSGTQSGQRSSGSGSPLSPVEAYLGVPYASPPVQTKRFMPPVTPSHWRGVRPAKQFGPVCPQPLPDVGNGTEPSKTMSSSRMEYFRRVMPFLRNQSEDCLYLNIYVPYNPSTASTTSTSGECFQINSNIFRKT